MENCSPIDHFFDLDLALTMPDYNSSGSSQSLGLKASSDSESASPDRKKSSPAPEMDTVTDPVGVCTVCMEGFGSGTIGKRVPCGHVYHAACIATWLSLHDSCPLCRSKFDNISVDRQN